MDRGTELFADIIISPEGKHRLRVKWLYNSILRAMGAYMPERYGGWQLQCEEEE